MTSTAALALLAWLQRSKIPGQQGIRERYKVSAQTWDPRFRPDCNAEMIYAATLAAQETGDTSYLTWARNIWTELAPVQKENGGWPFTTTDGAEAENDNSEVAIFLLRAAALDPVNAAAYRAAAADTTDLLLTRLGALSGVGAMWSAHIVAALATALPYTSNPSGYTAGIESALSSIMATEILPTGRVLTSMERDPIGNNERWRPPSSDQAITIRGFAMAEAALPTHPDRAAWTAARQSMLGWLGGLHHASGAVRNGYGEGLTHADVWHITDHVYTSAFAIEAYRRSHEVDGVGLERAQKIAEFVAGNIYYSETDPDANGCLRGAYDLIAQDFDTSEVAQNGGEEGGGDMAYTGWSAAPIAAHLFEMGVDAAPASSGRRGAAVAFL